MQALHKEQLKMSEFKMEVITAKTETHWWTKTLIVFMIT